MKKDGNTFLEQKRCPNCGRELEYRGIEKHRDGKHETYYCVGCDRYRVVGFTLYVPELKEKLPGYAAGGK